MRRYILLLLLYSATAFPASAQTNDKLTTVANTGNNNDSLNNNDSCKSTCWLDSLQHTLTRLQQKAKDKRLQAAIEEALAQYQAGGGTNLFYPKLLQVDSLLINDWRLDEPLAFTYGETLLAYLRQLYPLKNHPDYAQCLITLCKLHWYNDRYKKAIPYYLEALAVQKKTVGEESAVYANSLFDIGNLYRDMGDFVNHQPYFEQLVAVRKKTLGEESTEHALALHFLGLAYWDRGEYDSAMLHYQHSLTILKKTVGENHLEYVHTLNDMAHVYNQTGEYVKALPSWQHVLRVRKKEIGQNNLSYAWALNGLAVLYYYVGDYDKALASIEQTLSILQKSVGREHSAYPYNLDWLALVYLQKKNCLKALACSREALSIQKKVFGEEHYFYADGLENITVLYEAMGNYNAALLHLEQALAIRKKTLGEEHAVYAQTLSRLASLYQHAGKYDSALLTYRRAITVQKKVLGEEHRDYISSLFGMATTYLMSGNTVEATALIMQACTHTLKTLSGTYATLSEQEKLAFLNKEALQFGYLPSLLYSSAKGQPEILQQLYQNELILKKMVLEDQKAVLSSIRNANDSSALLLYQQWNAYKTFLGKQLLLPPAKRAPYLDSLQEATDQLEQQLSRQSVLFRSQLNGRQLTAKDIGQTLSPGQAAIEFIRFPYYHKKWTDSVLYAALLLLPGDSIPRFIPLCEERALRRLLTIPKNEEPAYALQKIYRSENSLLPDAVYRLVWKPLQTPLKNVHTIYFAPAGLLHQVAFAALRDESSRYLVSRYNLHEVLSTRSVISSAPVAPLPTTVSLWGDIEYNAVARTGASQTPFAANNTAQAFNLYTADTRKWRGGSFASLPNTKKEISFVKKSFQYKGINAISLTGAYATEDAFKALSGNSPQVLHLATHGFFLPVVQKKAGEVASVNAFTVQQNPMFRSGLVLAGGNAAWKGREPQTGEDGILTAYEIAQLDLSNTDLIVLSACETALGELQGSEGVIGLQRALKLAGVKQMMVSLWRVPDKETVELMTMFYNYWLSGQTTRDALRKAQLKMKEKYPPFYWAAFVLIE